MKKVYHYISDIAGRYHQAQGTLLSKGIAYSLILATIPYLMLFIYISSVILKQNGELSRLLLSYLVDIIPIESAQYLSERLISYIDIERWRGISISGLVMMIFLPHTLFFAIEQALSKVMKKHERRAIHHQLLFTLFFQFFLLTLLFIFVYLSVFAEAITSFVNMPLFYRFLSSNTISIFIMSGMLIAVYRMSYGSYLHRRTLVGVSFAISVLWEFSSDFGATIISVSGKNELLYGIFAGGVVLLVWTYIFATLLILGGIIIGKETERVTAESTTIGAVVSTKPFRKPVKPRKKHPFRHV